MVEPGQDLLLAALSESGISPNDLFDIDSPDVVLATPTPAVQQVKTRAQLFVRGHKSLCLIYWEGGGESVAKDLRMWNRHKCCCLTVLRLENDLLIHFKL